MAGDEIEPETGAVVTDWRDEPPPLPTTPARRPTKRATTRRETARPARPRPRTGFCCPFCDTTDYPFVRRRIPSAGWIVFTLFLIFFFPLFWIGLLLKEESRECSHCRIRLDR